MFGKSPSIFGNNNNSQTSAIFGTNNSNQGNNIFGVNNNINNSINPNNFSFGANNSSATTAAFGNSNNSNSNNNPLFGVSNNNANSNNNPLFGLNNNGINKSNNIFSNINTGNSNNNIFGQNKVPNIFNMNNNNNNQQQQNSNNIFGNLSGINASINNNSQNNNNLQQNNNINQNQFLNLNDPGIRHDLEEYKQILKNIEKCSDPSQSENMFKDYLYMPIPRGRQPSEVNVYRPYTIVDMQQKIINDYNIWDKANKNNVDPNKFFPIQISSVDALLTRYKNLEKGILQSISKTVETQKNLQNLNIKIDDEMANKLEELKSCHTKLNKMQLNLSSKVAEYNYLLGTAKENVNDTQQIKQNLKKTNENINMNNMVEISDKMKKTSTENFEGENKDYIKEINKDKINEMMDALVEIQNMMNIINTNNKKNLFIVKGMQREVERILKKNEI